MVFSLEVADRPQLINIILPKRKPIIVFGLFNILMWMRKRAAGIKVLVENVWFMYYSQWFELFEGLFAIMAVVK